MGTCVRVSACAFNAVLVSASEHCHIVIANCSLAIIMDAQKHDVLWLWCVHAGGRGLSARQMHGIHSSTSMPAPSKGRGDIKHILI